MERGTTWRAFWLSVFIGAFAGISLQNILTLPIERFELWAVPVLILGYGLFAVPFVALGLVLFGIPVTKMPRKWEQKWWIGVVAILWGAIAGKLLFYAVDHVLFLGYYDIRAVSLLDLGPIYGVPTGVAWWLLRRRQLVDA